MNTDEEKCPFCGESKPHEHNMRPIFTGLCECRHEKLDHAIDLEGPSFCEALDCKCENYRPTYAFAICRSLTEIEALLGRISFPVMLKPAFTLDKKNFVIVECKEDFPEALRAALLHSPTGECLIEVPHEEN